MLYIVLKSETVQQIFTLSIADCIKGGVKFFVRFLCNINLCGIGNIGIGDICCAASLLMACASETLEPISFLISFNTFIKVF